MQYLNETGLKAFWNNIKDWTRTKHGQSISKGTATQAGIPLNLMNGADTPTALGATVTITKADITALGIPASDTTYTHPAGGAPSKAAGLYKFSTDSTSHVASVTPVTKADISPLESDPTVPTWAKAATKPSYEAEEIDYAKGGTTVGSKLSSLSDAMTEANSAIAGKQDTIADLATIRSGAAKGATAVQTETDPTVPAWAKAATKPTYNAEEIDYDADGEYSVKDILDSKQSKINDLATIRSGAAKGATAVQTETDPTVPAWAKAASKPSYTTSEISLSTIPGGFGLMDNLDTVLAGLASDKAPETSPTFTGTPKAPTAAAGTNTTQVATCAFVQSAVAEASVGAAKYQGGMTPASYKALTTYKQGWYWVVTEAGTIAGETCEIGDMVFCNTDNAAAGTKKDAHFDIVQNNIDAIPLSVINALS